MDLIIPAISAVASGIVKHIDWRKMGERVANAGVDSATKALWKRLKPGEQADLAKHTLEIFVEQFNRELESTTPVR
jgi:hypothetical protein